MNRIPVFSQSSLTALVVASMIGAGVYTTSGFALADLRSPWPVMFAWVVGGLIAICGAISYGQLADRITENGGEYLYLSRKIHPAAGLVAGWVSLLAGFTGAGAFAAIAFEACVVGDAPQSQGMPTGTLAIGLIAIMTFMHAIKIRSGIIGQDAMVLIKLSLIAIFIAIAMFRVSTWHHSPLSTPMDFQSVTWASFLTSVMWISLSYSGFNAAIYVAGDSKDGARSVAKAMIVASVLVTVVYLLLNLIFVFAPTMETAAGQKEIATIAAHAIGGKGLSAMVRLIIGLGLATSVSSILVAGPRVYAKMAEDGCLPRFFANDDSEFRRSILFQGGFMAVMTWFSNLSSLLSYLGLTLSLSAAGTVATLFLFRPLRLHRLVIPGIFVAATVVVAVVAGYTKPQEAKVAAATFMIGVLAFLVSGFSRKQISDQ
jgi:amino acid transporter